MIRNDRTSISIYFFNKRLTFSPDIRLLASKMINCQTQTSISHRRWNLITAISVRYKDIFKAMSKQNLELLRDVFMRDIVIRNACILRDCENIAFVCTCKLSINAKPAIPTRIGYVGIANTL